MSATGEMAAKQQPKGLALTATRGVMWIGAGQAVKQLVQVGTSVLLARMLLPSDFGLLGMSLVFIGIAQLFVDFGFGAAIVQSRSESQLVLSTCFWANVLVGAVLAILLALTSPFIADFYGNPAVGPIVAVSAISVLLSGAGVIPTSILYRDMKFALVVKAQVIASLTGSVVAVLLAFANAGVWSIVAQPLVGALTVVLLVSASARWRPSAQFSWPDIRSLARFSGDVFTSGLLVQIGRNADTVLIGRYLGSGPAGLYSFSYQLMLYPLQQVSGTVVKVLFPALSRLTDNMEQFRRAYLRCAGAIALLTFPMMFGLFSVAEDFVSVVLGKYWLAALPALQILTWVGMVQSITTTFSTVLLSTGNSRKSLHLTLVNIPILLVGMVAGLHWGIVGVATGYAIAFAFASYWTMMAALRLIDLPIRNLAAVLIRPFVAAALMMATVFALRSVLDVAPMLRLALLIGAGAIAYVLASLAFNRAQLLDLLSLVRKALSSG